VTATREEIDSLMEERIRKISPDDVNYRQSLKGSAFHCNSCFHGYSRNSDGFKICELIRSKEIDEEGIQPDYVCDYWTTDAFVYPLTEEIPNEESPEASGDEAPRDR
jgi:hypothetical protein